MPASFQKMGANMRLVKDIKHPNVLTAEYKESDGGEAYAYRDGCPKDSNL
jgi:hypothetical protein